uniref:rRNA adenine N(6)-methyltransferase n=1 Tax=Trichobilharzia regenti TaxID=157069 RepID=A0AA85KHH8_TRIRE|nr:unnamed protein product [Trichobilharzia regenti]
MGTQMEIYRQDIMRFNCEGVFPTTPMRGAGAWDDFSELKAVHNQLRVPENQSITALEITNSPRICVIGNLPFNISTPLVCQWLHDISERRGIWRYGRVPLILTFQKEVAERLAADVWDKQRSRLSIMSQAYCNVEYIKDIPGTAFLPVPKVDAGIVRLTPLQQPLIPIPYPYVNKLMIDKSFSMLAAISSNVRKPVSFYREQKLIISVDAQELFMSIFDRIIQSI